MNPVVERFEMANGILRRNDLALALPKGLILRALLRAGWRGTDGTLPEEVARHLVDEGPFHLLFGGSRGSGKVA
jgi:hypothetical protein